MANVGIVGTGISGIHLALFLQHFGEETVLYADRTPDEIRASRLPNTVARFAPTRERERMVGVDHWNFDDDGWAMYCAHVWIAGDPPLRFRGDYRRPASFVDFRLYLPRLIDDYVSRGGRMVAAAPTADELRRLAQGHDLMVVATGAASLTELFSSRPELSPYDEPQRRVMAGLFRGIDPAEPVGLSFSVTPGAGEVFQAPFFSFEGRGANLLVEAVPGGPLDPVTRLRYEDDPAAFDAVMLESLRRHAPTVYERTDPGAFGLTRPLDVLQGGLIPRVRQAWAPLGADRYALAVGDSWIVNDPLTGQGANLGSRTAWLVAEAIREADTFGEDFCRATEERMWDVARPTVEWTNAMVGPPAPQALGVFLAAAAFKSVADALVEGFEDPAVQWPRFATPEGADAFLGEFGLSMETVLGTLPPVPA